MARVSPALLSLLLLACGGAADPDAGAAADGGGEMDAAAPTDAGPTDDAGDIDGGDEDDAGLADGGPLDAGTDAAMDDAGSCTPVAADEGSIGATCEPDGTDCPEGYECQGLSGIVVTYSCQIPCTAHCDCPGTTECGSICDKAGCRMVCAAGP